MRHDGNGGCDGYGRVNNDEDINVPSGETHAMSDGHPITVARAEGLLSRKIAANGGRRGGVNE